MVSVFQKEDSVLKCICWFNETGDTKALFVTLAKKFSEESTNHHLLLATKWRCRGATLAEDGKIPA
jgi:hypothetical protein